MGNYSNYLTRTATPHWMEVERYTYCEPYEAGRKPRFTFIGMLLSILF